MSSSRMLELVKCLHHKCTLPLVERCCLSMSELFVRDQLERRKKPDTMFCVTAIVTGSESSMQDKQSS